MEEAPSSHAARGESVRLRVVVSTGQLAGLFLPRLRASLKVLSGQGAVQICLPLNCQPAYIAYKLDRFFPSSLAVSHWLVRRMRSLIGGSQPDMESRERGGCRR